MLLCLGFRDGGCLVKGFKILLYTLAASFACRSVAENTEDSIKVASCTRIFSLDSIITAIICKFIPKAKFSEDEHLVKLLYLALETDNRRYAIGNEYHGLIVIRRDGYNAGALWNHGYALRRGIGYGIAIQYEEGIPNRVMRVIINDTYHLLRPKMEGEGGNDKQNEYLFHACEFCLKSKVNSQRSFVISLLPLAISNIESKIKIIP